MVELDFFTPAQPRARPRVWAVGALLMAVTDSLEARFNPVAVAGEISGFSRGTSGHCYFSLKDESAQIRCAMFRRAASLMDFLPRDGQRVEVRGRLGVYEARGELQMVVESIQPAGQGSLLDEFFKLKAKLEAEGLFDASRKKALPTFAQTVGIVTSLGAAALHDVLSALSRRAPHVSVVIYPASVQGAAAPGELCQALRTAYARGEVDVLLLVRGGGSMEDLWAFNDEQLARTLAASPLPTISGVGHETDFTLADFCADVRAPTPTAAAELCAAPRDTWLQALALRQARLQSALDRRLQGAMQQLDWAASRLARRSQWLSAQQAKSEGRAQRLEFAQRLALQKHAAQLSVRAAALRRAPGLVLLQHAQRLASQQARLDLLNPQRVIGRGYAWLADASGAPVTEASQTRLGQTLVATLADGKLDLMVSSRTVS